MIAIIYAFLALVFFTAGPAEAQKMRPAHGVPLFSEGDESPMIDGSPVLPTPVCENRSDYICMSGQYIEKADTLCIPMIEGLAKRDFMWLIERDGATAWTSVDWADQAKTTLRYRGNKIVFLTPFNNWVGYYYTCYYNFAADTARITGFQGQPPLENLLRLGIVPPDIYRW